MIGGEGNSTNEKHLQRSSSQLSRYNCLWLSITGRAGPCTQGEEPCYGPVAAAAVERKSAAF